MYLRATGGSILNIEELIMAMDEPFFLYNTCPVCGGDMLSERTGERTELFTCEGEFCRFKALVEFSGIENDIVNLSFHILDE